MKSIAETEACRCAAEHGEYRCVMGKQRRAYHPGELPDHLKEAIGTAKMDRRHAHLDKLLKR
jgi:hypothetical protein